MFRDGSNLYYNSKSYGGNHDKTITRMPKHSEEAKKLKSRIKFLKESIYTKVSTIERFENGTATTSIDEYIKKHKDVDAHLAHLKECIKKETQELREAKDKLYELQKTQQPSHKFLKRTFKKRSKEWIKTEVLKIIEEAKKADKWFLHKEDVARRLNVKECFVEQVFMELNREGILSQASHRPMHDCSRDYNAWGGGFSGWAGDIYSIREKNK